MIAFRMSPSTKKSICMVYRMVYLVTSVISVGSGSPVIDSSLRTWYLACTMLVRRSSCGCPASG